ncbi:MAG: ArsR/SmtB family transcription factor [Microbacterium sp.]
MVAQRELSEAEVDRVFHALATSTRRDILRRTIEREQSVSTLASEYEMSFAAVQKHVAVLEAANLIVKRLAYAGGGEDRPPIDPSWGDECVCRSLAAVISVPCTQR